MIEHQPVVLSGGTGRENVNQRLRFVHPHTHLALV